MMTELQHEIAADRAREAFSADGDADAFRAELRRLGLDAREIEREIAEATA